MTYFVNNCKSNGKDFVHRTFCGGEGSRNSMRVDIVVGKCNIQKSWESGNLFNYFTLLGKRKKTPKAPLQKKTFFIIVVTEKSPRGPPTNLTKPRKQLKAFYWQSWNWDSFGETSHIRCIQHNKKQIWKRFVNWGPCNSTFEELFEKLFTFNISHNCSFSSLRCCLRTFQLFLTKMV